MNPSDRRSAAKSMTAACASLGLWPEALLGPDFISGLSALAIACDELSIPDAAIALVAADPNPGLSGIARALLAERTLRRADTGGNTGAVGFSRPSTDRTAPSPIDLADFAAAVELEPAVFDRYFAPLERSTGAVDLRRPLDRLSTVGHEPNADAWPNWTWPVAEPDRRLVAPAMTFSASRLNAFARCPRRWYYEYLCDAVVDTGSLQATYGRVFHEALEALHRVIRVPSNFTEHEILAGLSGELDTAFGKARADFASALEYEVCRLRARSVAGHYSRWLAREAQARPLEVRDVEIAQRWSHGGYVFVGYIDRIDRPVGGGPITIYDYKTGRIDDDPAAYLERIRNGNEGQLALYWAMRRALGDDVTRIALISIRDPRDATWLLALDIVDPASEAVDLDRPSAVVNGRDYNSNDGVIRIECTPADLARSIEALVARCEMISLHGIEHFGVGEDPPCSMCAYAQACRERPEDEERIFAR